MPLLAQLVRPDEMLDSVVNPPAALMQVPIQSASYAIWGEPASDRASVGTGGVGSGCTRPWGCSMATASTTAHAESAASMIGHINLGRNPAGKRSAGKPPATFDEAGTGDVAWLRYSGTRRRKSEQQRTQTSTYTGAPVLDPTLSTCRFDSATEILGLYRSF